jgi:hypothetical protein
LTIGSTAAEREGAFYHLSANDHPAFGLNKDPKRLSPGTLSLVGITRKAVSVITKNYIVWLSLSN